MSVDFTTTIQNIVETELENIHTAIPARITKINEKDVDVQPSVAIVRDGKNVVLPEITQIPFMFPQGAAGGIQWELEVGESVLLMVSECSLDAWLSSEESGTVPALDAGQFQLKDAVAIPGLSQVRDTRPLVQDFGMEVRHKDTTITIMKNGEVVIGGDTAKQLVNSAFLEYFMTHTHISGTGVPSTPPNFLDVLTQKTSAE